MALCNLIIDPLLQFVKLAFDFLNLIGTRLPSVLELELKRPPEDLEVFGQLPDELDLHIVHVLRQVTHFRGAVLDHLLLHLQLLAEVC